jgi:hypothetical protein
MAEKRTIDINIKNNADEATKDFNTFNDALDETAKSAKNVNSTFEEVYGDLQPLTTRLGEAEDRLYELALAGDTTSKEYQELLTKVGQYRKVQIETDLVVDSAATTLGQKLGGALSGATSGFAAVQGVMALVGGESEALEKTLVKVQAALAIQQGVQGIREAIPAFKQLGKTAKTALQGIKSGIAATGIGLLVVAVGTIVAYWDDISAAMGGAAAEGQKLLDQASEQAEYANKQYQDSVKYADLLRAEGKTEEEILAVQEQKLKAAIVEQEAAVKQAKLNKDIAIESTKFNQKVLQGILSLMLAPIENLISVYNKIASVVPGLSKIGSLSGTLSATFVNVEDTAKEADATIAQAETALNDLKLAEVQFQKNKKAKRQSRFKEEQREQAEQNKKLQDLERQRLQNLEDQRNAFLDRIAQIEEENYQRTLSDEERELRAVQDKYFELETLAENNAEQLAIIEEARLNEENEIRLRYAQEAYDAQKEIDDQAKADKDERDKQEKADAKALADYRIQVAQQSLTAIGDIAELFNKGNEKQQKRAFQVQKAVGIAQATINTAQAITKVFAETTDFTPTQSLRIANAVGIGLAGAAQIASIASQQFTGGGNVESPSDIGAGGGEVQAPSFNVVGDSGINQLAQLQQTPTMAYVVSGEVTSAQALDRNRVTNATL